MNKRISIFLICASLVVAGLIVLTRSPKDSGSQIVAISTPQGLLSNDDAEHGFIVLRAVYVKEDKHYEIQAGGICGRNVSGVGDLGKIGTAASLNQAIELYGMIEWEKDRILIGGLGGVKYEMPKSKWLALALENLANKSENPTADRL